MPESVSIAPDQSSDATPHSQGYEPIFLPLTQLRKHPRNYRNHPEDEITHIMESLRVHGFYRNIVVSEDDTILAGHGVIEAAQRMDITDVPVIRVPYAFDSPLALKILVADNEIQHLAEVDDRALSELLRELNTHDQLLGTGYDEMMLANLVMVTRPASEIADIDEAAQWVGMPEYEIEGPPRRIQMIINFASEEDSKIFCRLINIDAEEAATPGNKKTIWWPKRVVDDNTSILFASSTESNDD